MHCEASSRLATSDRLAESLHWGNIIPVTCHVPFPAAARRLLKGLSSLYRAASLLKGFQAVRLKTAPPPTPPPSFVWATLPYFGDSSGGGSTNVSLKSKEDGSEFSNYSSWDYSNYSHCIIFILCGILSAGSDVHRGPVNICTSVCMWEHDEFHRLQLN